MAGLLLFITRISEIIEPQPPLEQTHVEVMKGLHQRLSWSLSNNISWSHTLSNKLTISVVVINLKKLTTSQVTMSQKKLNGICWKIGTQDPSYIYSKISPSFFLQISCNVNYALQAVSWFGQIFWPFVRYLRSTWLLNWEANYR